MELITGSVMPWWDIVQLLLNVVLLYSILCIPHEMWCASWESSKYPEEKWLLIEVSGSILLYELKDHICFFNYPYFIPSAEAINVVLQHDTESRTRSCIKCPGASFKSHLLVKERAHRIKCMCARFSFLGLYQIHKSKSWFHNTVRLLNYMGRSLIV